MKSKNSGYRYIPEKHLRVVSKNQQAVLRSTEIVNKPIDSRPHCRSDALGINDTTKCV